MGLLAAALALAAGAIAVSGSARAPAELEEGSPEAVVQRYLEAVIDGDPEALAATLHRQQAADCTEADLDDATELTEDAEITATLRGVERDGGEAEVVVRITEYRGEPPLDGGDYEHTEDIVLARDGDGWGVVETEWPFLRCLRR